MAAPEGYKSLGTVGIAYKGVYQAETQYKYLNCVYYEGSTYLALKEVMGVTPSDNGVDWRYLAQGVVGPAAGFGEITATVDREPGDPNVQVEVSGPNTEKQIKFSFSGLKGEKGETGNEGPTGPVGPEGKIGPQGPKGDQGVSITNVSVDKDNHLKITLSDGSAEIDAGVIRLENYIPASEKGAVSGVATLDDASKIPESQMPDIVMAVAKPKVLRQTLSMTGWQGSSPLTYTIPVPGMTATQFVYITSDFTGKTKADITKLVDAFSDANITAKDPQTAGSVTLEAENKPVMDLPIVIMLGGEPENV